MDEKLKKKMEDKKAREEKNDKKYLIIMLIMFVVSCAGGYLIGRIIGKMKKSGVSFPKITEEFIGTLAWIMPIFFIVINVILVIVAIACISKSKKELKLWDGEDEEMADKIENRVSIPLCMSTIIMIINMFLFSVCINLDINSNFSDKREDILSIVNVVVFLLSLIIVTVVQKKTIDITKEMNPEKEGSIFDVKFSEKWEKSCDEAQKLQIYKAGSAGFKAMSSACMTLWIVCLVADLFWNTGLFPTVIVVIIWIVGNISYLVGAAKEEKKKKISE